MKKAILFLNGAPPKIFPILFKYDIIACADGAYDYYQKKTPIPCHFVIGDFDSLSLLKAKTSPDIHSVYLPDQNYTDFEKSLDFLIRQQVTDVDVYGATGNQNDHFIANLSVALHFSAQLTLTFYDDHGYFFFADNNTTLTHVKHKTISLLPFFRVEQLTTTGLQYPLNQAQLQFGEKISVRNKATSDTVTLNYHYGHLCVFVYNNNDH